MSTITTPNLFAPLADAEKTRLSELEVVVERGLAKFVEVGAALIEIRDSKLYRAEHRTFEAYCVARFGMKKSQAYRLIEASGIMANLSPNGGQNLSTNGGQTDDAPPRDDSGQPILPESERVARPLAKLDSADEQRQAWKLACETTLPGRKPTAQDVDQAVGWMKSSHTLMVHLNSIRDAGGVEVLTKLWTVKQRRYWTKDLRDIAARLTEWADYIEGSLSDES